ncbi:Ig-like domain-containing protein [Vibrio sp. 10N.222.49.A3]|uniref:Ig-like domain-containing protein n=1 Tax=Vibrio sp. 10N.222.49.A3 TaxID=3229611 RepID=UPI00354F4633
MKKTLSLFFVALAVVTAGGCKDSKNEGHKPMVYKPTKASPSELSVEIIVNGKKRTLELNRYSIREPDMKVYLWDHRINGNAPSSTIKTPDIRVYRGVDTSDENTQVIAALTTKNKLYVTAFRGSHRVWSIKDAAVTGGKSAGTIQPLKSSFSSVSRQNSILDAVQKSIKPIDKNPDNPVSGLDNILPTNMSDIKLSKINAFVQISYQTFKEQADGNFDDAMVLADYYINLVDYVYSRDALIRFSMQDVLIETWGHLRSHYNNCIKSSSHDRCKDWGYQNENTSIKNATRRWVDAQRKTRHWDVRHRMIDLVGSGVVGVNWGSYVRSMGQLIQADGVVLHETSHYLGTGHHTGGEEETSQGGEAHVGDIGFVGYKNRVARRAIVGPADYPLPPSAKIDHFGVLRDTAKTLDVLKNDFDANGDSISINKVDSLTVQGGQVKIVGDKLVYTPPKGFVGEDSFFYQITDSTKHHGKQLYDREEVHLRVTSPGLYARFGFESAIEDFWIPNEQTGLASQLHVSRDWRSGKDVWVDYSQSVTNDSYGKTLTLGAHEAVRSIKSKYDVPESFKYNTHYGHAFDLGDDSFTVSLKVKVGTRLPHDINLVNRGMEREGYHLRLLKDGKLKWYMKSRQYAMHKGGTDYRIVTMMTESPLPADSAWHAIAVRVDRTTNQASLWVDGVKQSLVDEAQNEVNLPKGYAGLWGGGSRRASSISQGLTIGQAWWDTDEVHKQELQKSQSRYLRIDNVELRSFALTDDQISKLTNNNYVYPYAPRPYNGEGIAFSGSKTLSWKLSKSSAYKLMISRDGKSWSTEKIGNGSSGSHTVALNASDEALYWRVDVNGSVGEVWSVRNNLVNGRQEVAFSHSEISNGAAIPDCEVKSGVTCLFGWPATQNGYNDLYGNTWTIDNGGTTNWEGHIYLGGKQKTLSLQVDTPTGEWSGVRFRAAAAGKGWTGADDYPSGTLKLYANGKEVWKAYNIGDEVWTKAGTEWASLPSIGTYAVSVPRKVKSDMYGVHFIDLPANVTQLKWEYESSRLDSKGMTPGAVIGGVQLIR